MSSGDYLVLAVCAFLFVLWWNSPRIENALDEWLKKIRNEDVIERQSDRIAELERENAKLKSQDPAARSGDAAGSGETR